MVANMRQNITRIFGKNINNHHIIAIIKRWHHRENNRWGFVGTIIAYLRHASDRGVSLPRVGNIFDVTNPGLTIIAYLRHAARSTRPTARHRLLTEGQQTNHYIAMGDVVIRLLIFCCSFALFRCESQAHAVVYVVAASYIEVVTASYAAVGSAAAPATTTQHAVRPTGGTSRIGLWATAIAAIPIIAPLIYIATHVEKPKYIRCLTGYFMCA